MRNHAFALVAAGLVAACTARAAAQSLADVAKKEEDRRKQVASGGKVYTNKDLSPAPPPSTPPSATPSGEAGRGDAGAAKDAGKTADGKAASGQSAENKAGDAKPGDGKAGDGKAGDKDTGGKKDQAYWSSRMKAAQETADRDSTLADAMQSRISSLTADYAGRDDPAQRQNIERDRQRALAELDRLKKQVIADKKAIADLEDEARRAGVPPGWLR